MVFVMATMSCEKPAPSRPTNVPGDAIYVAGPKGAGVWQACRFNQDTSKTRCQIQSADGTVIYDDDFVAYSGPQPLSNDDLKLSPAGGDQWVKLENGTILIPKADEAELRSFLDWLFGKKKIRTE
jgi:hypothetical protein